MQSKSLFHVSHIILYQFFIYIYYACLFSINYLILSSLLCLTYLSVPALAPNLPILIFSKNNYVLLQRTHPTPAQW